MKGLTGHTGVLAGAFALLTAFSAVQMAQAETIQKVEGISNFGQITDSLYRGAQPSAAGLAALHQMGVSIVVNFRNDNEAEREKSEVQALGMKYVNIAWSGRDEPNNAQIVQFLNLVRDNPGAKIFIHCQRGADRTGTMAAAYRVAVEHRSIGEAISEMHRYHYAHSLLPHLQRYIDSLPQRLRTNATFAAYALPAAGVAPTAQSALATAIVGAQ